jgi:hypothetical protein
LQQLISLLFRCVHHIVRRNSGRYNVSGFVHDFVLHEIQGMFGTAPVRDRQHHRHHVRGEQLLTCGLVSKLGDTPPTSTTSKMSEGMAKAQAD